MAKQKETIEVTTADTVEIWFTYKDEEPSITLYTQDNGHLTAARADFEEVKKTGKRLGCAVKQATLKRGRRYGEGGFGRVIEKHTVRK